MVSTFTVGSPVNYNSIQRTNLHPNPKAGVDTSGFLYNASGGSSPVLSVTRQTLAGPIAEINTMIRASLSSGTAAYLDVRNTNTLIPVNQNLIYSFSGYVRGIGATTSSAGQYIQWIAADGATVLSTTSQVGITTTSGTWQRPAFDNQIPPAGSAYAVYILRVFSSSTFSTGNLIDVTGWLVEAS